MDTSEQYIKMCDCPEIQSQWERKIGDVFAHRWEDGTLHVERNPLYERTIGFMDNKVEIVPLSVFMDGSSKCHIWLPRQDQLQAMVLERGECRYLDLCEAFYEWLESDEKYIPNDNDYDTRWTFTMEQLWLAFVMKEKHGKVWNGDAWISG